MSESASSTSPLEDFSRYEPREQVKVCIADLGYRPVEYYSEVLGNLGGYALVDWPGTNQACECDVLLLSDEFCIETAASLPLYHKKGIPSVHLIDGVVEWRNLFENPRSWPEVGGAPLFQPLMATTTVCLGRWQQSLLQLLGANDRVVPLGSPRFDPLLTHQWDQIRTDMTYNILVSTARTPGFTSSQYTTALDALRDIRKIAPSVHVGHGREVKIRWRISDDVANELGWQADWGPMSRESLLADLNWSHAVITTPSTVAIEAMVARRPAAVIDYTATPRLILTAWAISSKDQIAPVLQGMAHPDKRHMALQQFFLEQQLECELSGPRVAVLIRSLISLAKQRRGEPHSPTLQNPQCEYMAPAKSNGESPLTLQDWQPHYGVFYRNSVDDLQAEVLNLRRLILKERDASERRLSSLLKSQAELRDRLHLGPIGSARRTVARLLQGLGRTIGPKE